MSVGQLEVLTALQILAQSALTIEKITALLAKDNLTLADVQAQIDQTDATIDRVKTED
jgi:hypothetical protein